MTFHIDRNRYETTDLSFSGMPQVANAPDVPGDTKVIFVIEVKEDLVDEFRRSVSQPGFSCEIAHGEYRFKIRNCHLTQPLPDRDYGSHKARITFSTTRNSVIEALRPLAPPPPPDQADVFLSQLHILSQDHDLLRRKRLSLAAAFEELEGHRSRLDEAEKSLDLKKAALFATGTPDLILIAKNRGL